MKNKVITCKNLNGFIEQSVKETFSRFAIMKLLLILYELREINYSVTNSLEKGLEEMLTLPRFCLVEELGKSPSTTNNIENLNFQLSKYLPRIKYCVAPGMRARWVTTVLLQIEKRMRKINNYKKVKLLRLSIKSKLKLFQTKVA